MVVVRKKAGSTFAYSGVVKGLAPGINWGVAASDTLKSGTTIGVPLHTTLTKASDYNTSGKWLLTLRATSAETMVWWASAQNTYSDLTFDIKFLQFGRTRSGGAQ